MQIKFKALDYTSEDTFVESDYEYNGNTEEGWQILRNNSPYLSVGPGYKLLKTKSCGVCSTDLDRRFLPHPLPQIIGHEVLAKGTGQESEKSFVVEINDTYEARGDQKKDSFCLEGIPTHSPERKVLGIDRLPGGFGPYMLVPQFAAIETNGISDKVAVLMEPFAAALQAIIASPPREGDSVAVLGPRRLGSLILAALKAYRNSSKINFRISAIIRHDHLISLANEMGADDVIDLRSVPIESLKQKFDILYDTTSTTSGFDSALDIAKREIHLKTTNGQIMGGLSHLTELVVDEISLLPADIKYFDFHWKNESRSNHSIFIFPSVYEKWKNKISSGMDVYTGSLEEAKNILMSDKFQNKVPRFDLVIVGSSEEIGLTIRPNPKEETSLVRPRSAILVDTEFESNWTSESKKIRSFFREGKSIRSSRCGDFHYALKLLKENPEVTKSLENRMISHNFPSSNLTDAYAKAKDPSSVKVVVNFD